MKKSILFAVCAIVTFAISLPSYAETLRVNLPYTSSSFTLPYYYKVGLKRRSMTAIVGGAKITGDYSDIAYTTLLGDIYFDNNFGFSGEIGYLNREQNATHGSLTTHYFLNDTWDFHLGGSTSDRNSVRPEYAGHFSFDYKTAPEVGLVISPSVASSDYRNGVEEKVAGLQVIQYLPRNKDSFWVVQGNLNAAFVNPGNHESIYGSLTGTYAEVNNYSLSVSLDGGESRYSSVLDLSEVDYNFIGTRANLTYELNKEMRVFVGTEYSHNKFFDLYGARTGLNVSF